MKSKNKCFLCGRNGSADHLDMHHIFNGAYRKKSEKYKLVVPLCHYRCHIFGKYAVHNNYNTMLYLKHKGQQKVMREQGWDEKRFIREFGKNYTAIFRDHAAYFDFEECMTTGGYEHAEYHYHYGETDKGSGTEKDTER